MIKEVLLILGIVAVFAAQSVAAPDNGSRGFLLKSIQTKDDTKINYTVYVPMSYDGSKKMPMIIFLHGMGECGTNGTSQLVTGLPLAIMRDYKKWDDFITLIPQKQEFRADWELDESEHVMEIYEETIKTYNIDTTKIYLTGLSQGGRGTWKIAARYPKMFAAIAPMCGWADEDTAKAIKHIPIWAFHGEIDQVVKVESTYNMEKWLKAAGTKDLKVTIYPGVDHGCWDMAYQNEALPEFFLKHSTK